MDRSLPSCTIASLRYSGLMFFFRRILPRKSNDDGECEDDAVGNSVRVDGADLSLYGDAFIVLSVEVQKSVYLLQVCYDVYIVHRMKERRWSEEKWMVGGAA